METEIMSTMDSCIKCGACTAQCPVAAVLPDFPGPKNLGPDAERLRLEGVWLSTKLLSYCTNCKTCEITCSSGVKLTDFILQAKANPTEKTHSLRRKIRDKILGHVEYLGKLGSIFPNLTNTILGWPLTRVLMEYCLEIVHQAPLPTYKKRHKVNCARENLVMVSKQKVVFFPGCFVRYNNPALQDAVLSILEHNRLDVTVPPELNCCGLPLTANGNLNGAKSNAINNLKILEPFLNAGVSIVAACTSCGMTLKEEYTRIDSPGRERIGTLTYDLFEFLWELYEQDKLRTDFKRVEISLGHHAPCHLKAQGIGTPSVRLLRQIPGVNIKELEMGCCGLSGSYGFKTEKSEISKRIGHNLLTEIIKGKAGEEFKQVVTECGSCQSQIQAGSNIDTMHPIFILLEAYGLKSV